LSAPPPTSTSTTKITGKGDTACSLTLLKESLVKDPKPLAKPIAIESANGGLIEPTGTAQISLSLDGKPFEALLVSDSMLADNLVSINQVCREHKALVTTTDEMLSTTNTRPC